MAHPNAWRECPDPPWTTPADEADLTEAQKLTEPLEERIDQLMAELTHWGRHKDDCPARHGSFPSEVLCGVRFAAPSDCLCGLTEALEGRLWEGIDGANLTQALEALEDK